ncbi:hypothetical protein SDJN02_07474, partial [Cucurbita argyrosperma subsp. argyrosperma]
MERKERIPSKVTPSPPTANLPIFMEEICIFINMPIPVVQPSLTLEVVEKFRITFSSENVKESSSSIVSLRLYQQSFESGSVYSGDYRKENASQYTLKYDLSLNSQEVCIGRIRKHTIKDEKNEKRSPFPSKGTLQKYQRTSPPSEGLLVCARYLCLPSQCSMTSSNFAMLEGVFFSESGDASETSEEPIAAKDNMSPPTISFELFTSLLAPDRIIFASEPITKKEAPKQLQDRLAQRI